MSCIRIWSVLVELNLLGSHCERSFHCNGLGTWVVGFERSAPLEIEIDSDLQLSVVARSRFRCVVSVVGNNIVVVIQNTDEIVVQ